MNVHFKKRPLNIIDILNSLQTLMEAYIFRYSEWLVHYNCSFLDVDQIPLEQRRHPIIGSTLLVLAVIFEILYIPCLISINRHSEHPCYNLMRFIGVLDVIVMLINGIFTGIGLINGWVYCSFPNLIFYLGTIVTSKSSLYLRINITSRLMGSSRVIESDSRFQSLRRDVFSKYRQKALLRQ